MKRPGEELEASDAKLARQDADGAAEPAGPSDGATPVVDGGAPAGDSGKPEAPQKDLNRDAGRRGGRGRGKRGRGRGPQRDYGTPREPRQSDSDEDGEAGEGKEPRMPKRKVALMMSYCGTGYQGMQINPNAKSIEGDLWKALVAAGAVSKDNANDPKKVSFHRAARTDKGVHALGQVVSVKMTNLEDPEIIGRINSHLPDQIRVWGVVRTMKSFNAKNACDSRIYEYLLPTYVFIPPHPGYYPESKLAEEPLDPAGVVAFPGPDAVSKVPHNPDSKLVPYGIPPSSAADMASKREYRIKPEQLQHLREVLRAYEGTRNYHNYTVGRRFEDNSSKRYILNFNSSDPFVKDGMEWLSLKVKGQSFMLHQIRKMVGMAIMLVRTKTPIAVMPHSFSSVRFNIPKAPALGLLLRQVVYDHYNERQRQNNPGYESSIDFSRFEKEMDEFRDTHITSTMVEEETKLKVFDEWVRVVDCHSAEFRWYVRRDGSIAEDQKPQSQTVDALDKELAAGKEEEAEDAAGDDD
ncbi:tRNA pseudouridine synthase [Hyaloraphidium curvatum]|nr:tRNA pseudouridine synthase [Hyaloraphidium curvatum]